MNDIERFLLSEAQVDLVDFSFLVSYTAQDLGISNPELHEKVLSAVREVLVADLVQAGELEDEHGPPLRVKAWELEPEAAIKKMADKWSADGNRIPSMGAVCWFSLTPAGRAWVESKDHLS